MRYKSNLVRKYPPNVPLLILFAIAVLIVLSIFVIVQFVGKTVALQWIELHQKHIISSATTGAILAIVVAFLQKYLYRRNMEKRSDVSICGKCRRFSNVLMIECPYCKNKKEK